MTNKNNIVSPKSNTIFHHRMKKIFITSVFLLAPMVALAQNQNFSNLTNLINFFTNLIYSAIVPLLVALAVAYFIWGLVTFIRNADNDAEREKGRTRMIWGVIALFVIVAVWGLVGVLANTFGVRVGIPGPPGSSGSGGSGILRGTGQYDPEAYRECLKTNSAQVCAERYFSI